MARTDRFAGLPTRAPVSVVVCTLDEAGVIERCLASVAWADERLVLDSGSTDATRELAAAAGAVVQEQPWLGFSAQKNHAARLASHDWVLSLDADEIVTDGLRASIERVLEGPLDPADGYVVDRRGDFLGAILPNQARRSKRRTLVRLYNRTRSAWDESMAVHEVVRVPGRSRPLTGRLLHVNEFTVDEFATLFNRYATLEAAELHRQGVRAGAGTIVVRPVLRFLWHYVARGEARMGTRGVIHAGMKAVSEFLRYAKLWEIGRAERRR